MPGRNMTVPSNSKKHGVHKYLSGLFAHIFPLAICNLLFIALCLPVVTAGAALIALNRVACLIHRGVDQHLILAFLQTVKREFKTGLVLNVMVIPIMAAATAYCLRCVRLLLFGNVGMGVAVVIFLIFFLGCAICVYFLPLLACMDGSFGTALKNAVLLCGTNGLRTVAGSASTGMMLLAGFITYPYSFPFLALIWFSIIVYNGSFFGWFAAERFIFLPYYREHPEAAKQLEFELPEDQNKNHGSPHPE